MQSNTAPEHVQELPAPKNAGSRKRVAGFLQLSLVLAIVVVVVGAIVLAGWLLHIEILKSVLPGLATMKFNTALCFVLAGLSLLGLQEGRGKNFRKKLAMLCAMGVVAIAAVTLAEFLVGRNFGLDELVIADAGIDQPIAAPGRMSEASAVCFMIFGAALLLLEMKTAFWQLVTQLLALTGLVAALIALEGYIFSSSVLYHFFIFSSLALHTAFLFLLLGLALLCARPQLGLMATFSSSRIGGVLLRRGLPLVVGVPIVIVWLRLEGQRSGWYDADSGIAVFPTFNILVFAAIIWIAARSLNRLHAELDERNLVNARMAAIVECSDDAIIGKDLSGTVTSWNRGAELVFGFSAAEMIGQPIVRLMPPERQHEEQQILARIMQGQRTDHFETVRLHKSGRQITVSITVSPIRNDAGEIVGASKVARDVSERLLMEERFRISVESAPTAMIMADSEGRITLVNTLTESVFGYSRAELLGQAVEMLLPLRYRALHPGLRNSFFQVPAARRMGEGRDLYGLRKNGSEFEVEIGLNPIETSEGVFVLAAVADITERKRNEQQLRSKTEELQRSNRDLEQFAYVASHDLQEPLRAVAGCVQLLQRRYQGQLDANADELIGHAVDGASRMQNLIDDLLTYSRVGRDDEPLLPADCEMSLAMALNNLATALSESCVKVSHDHLPVVSGITSQLALVFQNLVGNAIKFRQLDKAGQVHISVLRKGKNWEFSVEDNGIGIDPKYFDRIFAIFQRLHTRRQFTGTGIGLALCKRIIERHGGRIWVDSAPGQGAAFRFTVPAADTDLQTEKTVMGNN